MSCGALAPHQPALLFARHHRPARRPAGASTMPALKIDIWSDLSCPWCYVGKKRLDQALASVQALVDVEVQWHAYIIDPRTNPAGEEYLAYNRRRWGGDGWTQDLRRSGRPDGATFADWRWWPASLHAHRLVALASRHGKGHEAKDLLLRLTYDQGQNISSLDTLLAAGRGLGLPGVEEYLRGEEGTEEVLADDAFGKDTLNIRGVPYFIISNPEAASGRTYALSGAQPAAAFEQTMRRALSEGSNCR